MLLAAWIGKVSRMAVRQGDLYSIYSRYRKISCQLGKVSRMAVRQGDLYSIYSRYRNISCCWQHELVMLAAWPCGREIFIQYIVDIEKSHAAGSMRFFSIYFILLYCHAANFTNSSCQHHDFFFAIYFLLNKVHPAIRPCCHAANFTNSCWQQREIFLYPIYTEVHIAILLILLVHSASSMEFETFIYPHSNVVSVMLLTLRVHPASSMEIVSIEVHPAILPCRWLSFCQQHGLCLYVQCI